MTGDRSSITESKDDSHVLLKISVRSEHLTDDVSHQPVLFVWSYLGLDDPEDFRDVLLNNGKLVVLGKPDRERHPEVEQARKICQRILSVIPQSCEGLVFLCDTLHTTLRSE